MSSGKINPNRNLAPMLASFFTMLYALIPMLIVIAVASDGGYAEWTYVLAGIVAIVFLVYIGRRFGGSTLVENSLLLVMRERREDPLAGYEPRKKGRRRRERFGTNKPPTVEDLREIREASATSTWRPRGKS